MSLLFTLLLPFGINVYATLATADNVRESHQDVTFPDDFEFGTSTSAYQIEGAWNTDGKGWSIWDHFVHTRPEAISNQTNGDIAANSYYLYKRDIEMLKELGVNNYRFSIAWTRIMPYGRNYINPLGIEHYNNVIDELLAHNITPFVTMYHWDLPQKLNELGGWLNEDIVDWFGDYVRVLYDNFGDRVKYWLTINEPFVHCYFGYAIGYHAPAIKDPGFGYYECGRNVLLANARAYRIYQNEFKKIQSGKVGLVLSIDWQIPKSSSEDDVEAYYDYKAFHVDHFIHPILSKTGNYPQIMIDRVASRSAEEGLNTSRLRPFTEEQIEYLKATLDYIGLNHYSTTIVYRNSSLVGKFPTPSMDNDCYVGTYADPTWPRSGFISEYPRGLYELLHYLKDTYNNPLIYITENGISSKEDLNDDDRVRYYRNYMASVAAARSEGANVKGYFAWSLMDTFEWNFGYQLKFGLYHVNMSDPNKPRRPRKSALIYKEIIKSRTIDFNYDIYPYTYYNASQTVSSVTPTLCFSFVLIILSLTLNFH